MKRIRIAAVLTSLLLVAPLCYAGPVQHVIHAPDSTSPTEVQVSGSVTVSGLAGLAEGGTLWYGNKAVTKGTVLNGKIQASALTVVLPDAVYKKLTPGKAFNVSVLLTNDHTIQVSFMPTLSAGGSLTLDTVGVVAL